MKRIIIILVMSLLNVQIARASKVKTWDILSDISTYGLVGVAGIVPLYKQDWDGLYQAGLSVATASAIGLTTKAIINAPRPDGSGNDSFPSNHAANSFASATTMYLRYGWQVGFPSYVVATFASIARVQANEHYWGDVIVGAALGTASGYIFTERYNNEIQLLPWLNLEQAGLIVTYNW